MCWSRNVPCPFFSNPGLACTPRCLLQTVLRESREEPLKRSLSNLIEDFGSSSFFQNCMTVHSEDVADFADTKALAKESTLCLWVLTQLDSFVHGPNDIGLGQELVRDEVPRSNSDPELVDSGCGWRQRQAVAPRQSSTQAELHSGLPRRR